MTEAHDPRTGVVQACHPDDASRRRPRTGTVVALLFIAAGIASAFVINHRRQFTSQFVRDPDAAPEKPDPRTAADLQIYGEVDPFSLTEASGRTVTNPSSTRTMISGDAPTSVTCGVVR